MNVRLTPTELNALGAALVGGDLVAELEAIVDERVRRETSPLRETLTEWDNWSLELATLIPDGDESRLSNPEGAQEGIVLDCLRAYVEQLAAVRDLAYSQLLPSPDADDRLLAERLLEIVGVD